jgi:intracellular septation protein
MADGSAPQQPPPQTPSPKLLLLGGLLPIAAFAIVESFYGTIGGLIAGIVFGAGELAWEYRRFGRFQGLTLGSNALVIVLGVVSLYEGTGLWFKLQPAIILFILAVILIGSRVMGRPLLNEFLKKQNPQAPPQAHEFLKGVTLRMGFALLGITLIAVHAAIEWSTPAWATFKAVGAPVLLVVYMGIEVLVIRMRRRS